MCAASPDVTAENYDTIFNINVRGSVLGLEYGTPLLRPQGSILVTSSVVSIVPLGGNPLYAASKAALDSIVRSYAAQLAASDDARLQSLSVVSINPSLYETDMASRFTGNEEAMLHGFAKQMNVSGRVGKPNELSESVLKLVVGKDFVTQSGEHWLLDADKYYPLSEYPQLMASKSA